MKGIRLSDLYVNGKVFDLSKNKPIVKKNMKIAGIQPYLWILRINNLY